jgi:hypothetical protein
MRDRGTDSEATKSFLHRTSVLAPPLSIGAPVTSENPSIKPLAKSRNPARITHRFSYRTKNSYVEFVAAVRRDTCKQRKRENI